MKRERKIQWVNPIGKELYREGIRPEKMLPLMGSSLLSVLCVLFCMGAVVFAIKDVHETELPSVMWFGGFVAVMLAVAVIMDLAGKLQWQWSKYIPAAVLVNGILIFSIQFWQAERAGNLLGGILSFFRLYIKDLSRRYELSLPWYTGKPDYLEESLYYMVFFVFFLLLWTAKKIKRNGILLIFPGVVFGVEIVAGNVPGRWSFLLFVAGAILCCSVVWIHTNMQRVSTKMQDRMPGEQVAAWFRTGGVIICISAMILIVGMKPAEKVIWQYSDGVIQESAELQEKFFDRETLKKLPFYEEVVRILDKILKGVSQGEMVLNNDTPVYEYVEVLEVTVSQRPEENLYVKDFYSDSYEKGVWKGENISAEIYSLTKWQEEAVTTEDEEREYAYTYCLDTPAELFMAENIASEVEEIFETGEFTNEVYTDMIKAELLGEWMEEHTEYSLVLPKLPENTDPVEYFLGTTRSGYCTHYAGASVMILRKMGIPARFVSGYLVDKDDFQRTEEGYRASVTDDRAHAWVEIYLEDIGWIPVEVTRGYLPEKEVPVQSAPGGEGNGSSVSGEGATGSITVSDEKYEDNSSERQVTEGFVIVTYAEEEEDEDKIDWRIVLLVAGVVAFIGFVSLVSINTHKFFTSESTHYKQLRKEMRKGNHKNVILTVNSGIYRKLQYKQLVPPECKETNYADVLKSRYSELEPENWDRYMEIVKAAAFSEREFSKEEAKFCFEIYRDIIYKDEVW